MDRSRSEIVEGKRLTSEVCEESHHVLPLNGFTIHRETHMHASVKCVEVIGFFCIYATKKTSSLLSG